MIDIYPIEDYIDANRMANASNHRAIINWLDERIEVARPHYSGDEAYIEHVHALKESMSDYTTPSNHHSEQMLDELAWLWKRTWTMDGLWRIATNPVIALPIQVIANIVHDKRSDFGIADMTLYSRRTHEAEILSSTWESSTIYHGDEGATFSIDIETPYALTPSDYAARCHLAEMVPGHYPDMVTVEEVRNAVRISGFYKGTAVADLVESYSKSGYMAIESSRRNASEEGVK